MWISPSPSYKRMHAVLEESVKPEEAAKPGSVCRDGSFLFTYHVAIFLVSYCFVNILKLGTPKIITVIFLQMEQSGFLMHLYIQNMQTESKQYRPRADCSFRSLICACNVCSVMYVPILRMFIVSSFKSLAKWQIMATSLRAD